MDENKKLAISVSDFKLIIDKRKDNSNEISVKEPALKILQDKLFELEPDELK